MAGKAVKILVVEDEMIIAAKISMYLIEMGYEVTAIIPRSEEVLHHLEMSDPDIVLLDIQLKGEMDGVELAELLIKQHPIPIIFLTANSDEETFQRARHTKPFAFLTKPFKKIDLKRTLELTVSRMAERTVDDMVAVEPDGTPLTDRIFVLHKDRKVKIMLDTILYIEAERNYCNIITTNGNYLLTMPMKNLEASLPSSTFQRIHRSHIVNLKQVDEMDETTISVSGKLLGLSKTYRKEFLKRIKMV